MKNLESFKNNSTHISDAEQATKPPVPAEVDFKQKAKAKNKPKRPTAFKKPGSMANIIALSAALHGAFLGENKGEQVLHDTTQEIQKNIDQVRSHERYNQMRQQLVNESRAARERGEFDLGDFLLRANAIDIMEYENRNVDLIKLEKRYRELLTKFQTELRSRGVSAGQINIEQIAGALQTTLASFDYQGIGGGYVIDLLADNTGSCQQISHLVDMLIYSSGYADNAYFRLYPGQGDKAGHVAPIFRTETNGQAREFDLTSGRQAFQNERGVTQGVLVRADQLLDAYANHLQNDPGYLRARAGAVARGVISRGEQSRRQAPDPFFDDLIRHTPQEGSLPFPQGAIPIFSRGIMTTQVSFDSPVFPDRPAALDLISQERRNKQDLEDAANLLLANLNPRITERRAEVPTPGYVLEFETEALQGIAPTPATSANLDFPTNETGMTFTPEDWTRVSDSLTSLDRQARELQGSPNILRRVTVNGLRKGLWHAIETQSRLAQRGGSERFAHGNFEQASRELEEDVARVTPQMIREQKPRLREFATRDEMMAAMDEVQTALDETKVTITALLLQGTRGQELAWSMYEQYPSATTLIPFILNSDPVVRDRALQEANRFPFEMMEVTIWTLSGEQVGPQQIAPQLEGSDLFSRRYRARVGGVLDPQNVYRGFPYVAESADENRIIPFADIMKAIQQQRERCGLDEEWALKIQNRYIDDALEEAKDAVDDVTPELLREYQTFLRGTLPVLRERAPRDENARTQMQNIQTVLQNIEHALSQPANPASSE